MTQVDGILDKPTPARKFALLAYGFRPFFLLAALDALCNMGLWLAVYCYPSLWPDQAIAAMYWHAHEMLFGFVTAAIAGFLLTAVPGWTGRSSYNGAPLLFLAGLWVAGRIAMTPWALLPPIAASAIDLAFYPALALVLAPPLIRARKFKNMPFLGILAVLFFSNLGFHLGYHGVLKDGEHIGLGAAIDIVTILIVIVGGRIIPAFTKGGLARQGISVKIADDKWVEVSSIGSIIAVLVTDMAMPLSPWNGAIALIAALMQMFRLSRWHAHRTGRDPLLWVLHLGYAWLVVGLLLKGVWLLTGAVMAEKWVHALTVGAFTTMILAVMTRASLGHTGRALAAPRYIPVCYGFITIAAAIRVFAPALFPDWYDQIIAASGVFWIGAFAIFLWVYTPILLKPRTDGRPG